MNEVKEKDITVVGYPAEKVWGFDGSQQWKTMGKIFNIEDGLFQYDALTFSGYSGGPAWLNEADDKVIAVHIRGDIKGNSYGCPISQKMVDIINTLRAQWENSNS